MADGIQYEVEWPESGLSEKTGEMRAHVFRLVAQKCQGQVKVLCGNDASLYWFLQNGNPVDGMPVGYQCDKQSFRWGVSAGCTMA